MYSPYWPASLGVSVSVVVLPSSPWQPKHIPALSLPAIGSPGPLRDAVSSTISLSVLASFLNSSADRSLAVLLDEGCCKAGLSFAASTVADENRTINERQAEMMRLLLNMSFSSCCFLYCLPDCTIRSGARPVWVNDT